MSLFETLLSYSLIILVPVIAIGLASLLPARRWRVRAPLYAVTLAIAIFVMFQVTPGSSNVSSTAEANEILASGQPVFVEFFSNRCPQCLASEPSVRSLEAQVGDSARVLRLNVADSISFPLVSQFRATSTPTFVVLDANGDVVWRQAGSVLDKGAALAALGLS
jgi:thiol-disulfide isomerase/thioredoxin